MKTSNRVALFDFADTIAELLPSRQSILRDYLTTISGVSIKVGDINRAYRAIDILMQYSSVRIKSKTQRAEFYYEYNKMLFDLIGISHLADPVDLFQMFSAHKAHWNLKKGVREVFNELRSRGYLIGIISNFDSRLESIVYKQLDLANIVSYLHISQNEGIEKPNTRFYLNFFERNNILIKDSFYVGDSYILDYLPAKSIGLKFWLLDEFGDYPFISESIIKIDDLLLKIHD